MNIPYRKAAWGGAVLSLFLAVPIQAQLTNATLSNATIPFETGGTPNDVTINYTISVNSDIEVDIYYLKNVTDVPGINNQVAQIERGGATAPGGSITWSALWLIGGDQGRQDGNFTVVVHANDGTTTTNFTIGTPLRITSVDIHNVVVTTSFDANQEPILPYIISYSLAKDSSVTIRVKDAVNTTVRTLALNAPQYGENVKPTNTLTWNGLDDNGVPVPLGKYTVSIDANDGADIAITRTGDATIQSLASLDTDVQKTFATNSYVYPNPIRDGQNVSCGPLSVASTACFQLYPVRNNSTISLKIYTLAGDLVLDQSFPNLVTGNIESFPWNITNQSGKKIARGLYYYVMREEDEQGVLQTTKKLAVIR